MKRKNSVKIALLAMVMAFAVLGMDSCRSNGGSSSKKDAPAVKKLEIPTPPVMVEDKLGWTMLHFWDAFTDTATVSRDNLESHMANFCYLLQSAASRDDIVKAVRTYADKTAGIDFCLELAEKYLYDPNSPYRDEDLYAIILQKNDPDSPLLAPCSLNRVGTKAADFEYYDSRGRTHTLYKTPGRHTIIVFGNLECNACKEIKTAIQEHDLLQDLLQAGIVSLVSIPVEDDLSDWDDLYHIRAIPSVYLLDEDKTVIYKDCTIERLLAFLENEYR